ncbi:uncharacterized protein [Eurosta solidaginis]|uniref:uncharacterized protein n=1 Tax=Eurosta solidaginis TaxID=178769 RepID=UPI00353159D9
MKFVHELYLLFILLLPNLLSGKGQNTTTILTKDESFATNISSNMNRGKDASALRPAVERIFMRQKRFLLAPPKTRLKFTLNLSKQLVANIPSGFNFNIELACYYPMITSRLDLIPKRLRPTTTMKPKPKGPTTPLIVQIPGSLIRYKAKPATKPPKVQRIDENVGQTLQWVDTKKLVQSTTPSQYYKQPLKWQELSKYGAPGYAQRYEWTPAKQWPQKQPAWLSKDPKWSKWTTMTLPWAAQKNNQQKLNKWRKWNNSNKASSTWPKNSRWQRHTPIAEMGYVNAEGRNSESQPNIVDALDELDEIEPLYAHFPELDDHYEWKHYHNYRDRRQLYYQMDSLSGILGIDMKSCILRAICDCKRFLLPPGYSMVQDILRLMFIFPTKSGIQDEYSRIVQSDYEKCDLELKAACPFNMLAWLMGQTRN